MLCKEEKQPKCVLKPQNHRVSEHVFFYSCHLWAYNAQDVSSGSRHRKGEILWHGTSWETPFCMRNSTHGKEIPPSWKCWAVLQGCQTVVLSVLNSSSYQVVRKGQVHIEKTGGWSVKQIPRRFFPIPRNGAGIPRTPQKIKKKKKNPWK